MSDDRSKMANNLESNDTTSNLPPPGGGFIAPSSSDDDTANGNGPISYNKGTCHTLNTFSSARVSNGDETTRPSTSSSVAVGGARPKVRSFQPPRNYMSAPKELSNGSSSSQSIVNGYLRSLGNSDDLYEDPPSYEAAMAMANGSDVTYDNSNEMTSRIILNRNLRINNGQSNLKQAVVRNLKDIEPIPNGNGIEHTDDTDDLSESLLNEENNESDTDDDDLNEDEELTADLPKSFYILDVGSDSEGGNCSNQGVSRAGQSNLSSEVTKLLIQSDMVAQQSLQNGMDRYRLTASNSSSRRSNQQARSSAHRRRISQNGGRSHERVTNGDQVYLRENEQNERLLINQNDNMTPDEEADFLEMDFEPNESEDSDDSGDSGRGADETTDGNDAAEDLDEFVHDHGFGAASYALGDSSSIAPHSIRVNHDPNELTGASAMLKDVDSNQGNDRSNSSNVETPRIGNEIDRNKVLELPLAVKTNLFSIDNSNNALKSPGGSSSPSPQAGHKLPVDASKISQMSSNKRRDSDENDTVSNENSNGVISAPLQSPAGRLENIDELTSASMDAEAAMVRSRSLNSSLSSTLRRPTNSLNSCVDSPCLLMKASMKTSDSDPGNHGGIAGALSNQIKRRHISDNPSVILGTELLESSQLATSQNLPENSSIDMEACCARLSQREAHVFRVPHNGCISDRNYNLTSPSSANMRNSLGEPSTNTSNDSQVRSTVDPFQELSWISSTLRSSEVEETCIDHETLQNESLINDLSSIIHQNDRLRDIAIDHTSTEHVERTRDKNKIEKIMIWNEVEACKRQVNQVGVSACGATAVINVLQALEVNHDIDDVINTVPTRLRANSAPLAEYLVSRSRAGTTHQDLIDATMKITGGQVYGRFFHMYPKRNFSSEILNNQGNNDEVGNLSRWIGNWIQKGNICN